jgi:cytidylate kinase
MKKLTIAVDGFSGCGKSTIAKDLAQHLGYIFIDSGAMYRGVTLYAIQQGFIVNKEINKSKLTESLEKIKLTFVYNKKEGKQHLHLNGIDVEQQIRSLAVARMVSQIATISEIRRFLVSQQREMGRDGGIVMDGRDIGSVVFPEADLKFFITASPEIRAQRRLAELEDKGEKIELDSIIENLAQRDKMDTERDDSPLVQTEDAILIDTSNMTRESQINLILTYVHKNNA